MNSTLQLVVSKSHIEEAILTHLVSLSAVENDGVKKIEFSEKDFWNLPLDKGMVTIKIHKEVKKAEDQSAAKTDGEKS